MGNSWSKGNPGVGASTGTADNCLQHDTMYDSRGLLGEALSYANHAKKKKKTKIFAAPPARPATKVTNRPSAVLLGRWVSPPRRRSARAGCAGTRHDRSEDRSLLHRACEAWRSEDIHLAKNRTLWESKRDSRYFSLSDASTCLKLLTFPGCSGRFRSTLREVSALAKKDIAQAIRPFTARQVKDVSALVGARRPYGPG